MGEKVQGTRSINGRHKIDGEVMNSIENREGKDLICGTHGHELRRGNAGGRGAGGEGDKGEEKNGTTVIALAVKYT